MTVRPRAQSLDAEAKSLRLLPLGILSLGLLFLLSLSTAFADPLVWSEPIVIDPGTRAFDWYGFNERLVFIRQEDEIIATWSGEWDVTQVYIVDDSGQTDGTERRFWNSDSKFPWQIARLGEEWIGLETSEVGGLLVCSYSTEGARDQSRALDLGPVDPGAVRMEEGPDGFWIVWQSANGDVRRADVSPELEFLRPIETLGQFSLGLDVEFGEDGGVVAWTSEQGLHYVTVDPSGNPLHPPRLDGGATSLFFGVARLEDRILYVRRDGNGNFRVRGYAIDTGDIVVDTVVEEVGSEHVDVISGPDNLLVLAGRARIEAFLLDSMGTRGSTLEIGFGSASDSQLPVYAAAWSAGRYVVGWSNFSAETVPEGPQSRLYCWVRNTAEFRTVSPQGELGPVKYLNEVYSPQSAQPWFVNGDLHVLLRDYHSGRLQHVEFNGTESYELLADFGYSDVCDTQMMTTGTGTVFEEELYYGRYWEESSWPEGTVYTYSEINVIGEEEGWYSVGRFGDYFDIAVTSAGPWVATHGETWPDEISFTRVNRPDRTRVDIEPLPTRTNFRIINLNDEPFLIWEFGDSLLGGFVPPLDGEPIVPSGLIAEPNLRLQTAVSGDGIGLVVYTAQEAGEVRLFMLQPSGEILVPPSLLATSGEKIHAAWNGEYFFVTWLNFAEVAIKVARVTPLGEVLDFDGQTITTNARWSAPRIAVTPDGRAAVTYRGNWLRWLIQDPSDVPIESTLPTLRTDGPDFVLHPNPTSGPLHLSMEAGARSPESLFIFDVQGRVRVVVPKGLLAVFERGQSLDLTRWSQALPTGTYWVRTTEGGRSATQPIQIVR